MKSLVLLSAVVLGTVASACGGSDQLAKPAKTTTTSAIMNEPRPCPPSTTRPPPPGGSTGSGARNPDTGMSANPYRGLGPGHTPPTSTRCATEIIVEEER